MSVVDASAHYDALLAQPEHFSEVRALIGELGKGSMNVRALRPMMLSAPTMEQVVSAATAVAEAIGIAGERLVASKELRGIIGVARHVEEMLSVDASHATRPLLSRLDGLLDADGVVRFCEFNSRPTFGEYRGGLDLSAAFAGLRIAATLAERYPCAPAPGLGSLPDELDRLFGRRPRLGLVPRHGDDFFASFLAKNGLDVSMGAASEFTLDAGRLAHGGRPVDIIDAPFDVYADPDEDASAILEAIRAGAVRPFFGHALGLLMWDKRMFELLTNPEHSALFTRELVERFAPHVPWTRALKERSTDFHGKTIDLLPFVAAHRDRFVIKPAFGYSGAGVLLGWQTDATTWERGLRQPPTRPFVVQERIAIRRERVPMLDGDAAEHREVVRDINPILFDASRVIGFNSRTSGSDVTNTAHGGTLAPVWVLEDNG